MDTSDKQKDTSMKKIFFSLIFIFSVFLFPQKGFSALLAEYDLVGSMGISPASFNSLTMNVGYQPAIPLFSNIVLNAASTGQTFTANAGNNANFNAFAALLTNGIDELINIRFTFPNGTLGGNMLESFVFGPGYANLAGASLTSVDFTVNQLSFSPFMGSGVLTQMNFALDINGAPATPEPASMILFGSGLLGFFFYRRRS